MTERPELRPAEWHYGWTLASIGILVALIALLTRPAGDDVDGLLGVLGLVFSLGYIALVGASVLSVRYLMTSGALRVTTILLRVTTILAGPVIGLFALGAVVRLLT